ncbi:MAG: HD domain-containing protein [Chloroflexi bacterium]|nr:HD domain-containing protein [Chloroflexota bacterium]
MAATPRRWRRTFFLEFTFVFAFVALILSLGTGFALSRYLGEDIRTKTINDIAGFTEQVTARQIATALDPEQLSGPLQGEDLKNFDRFVRETLLGSAIVRVNVWNRDGTIVYSSREPLTGQHFPLNEHLLSAVGGETEAKVEGVEEGVEGAGLEPYEAIVEVYTPIRFSGAGEIAGAFEIYRDYGPIASYVRHVQRSIYIGIGLSLAAIYLATVLLVKRGSDLIRRQQKDLETRSEELKNSYDSIVSVLCAALDLRDNVTHGHARRVAALASVVAWQMGLRKEEVRRIEKAAILHDIGKIGVADAVLSKPGPLDHDEWAEMRRHPELGYQMLEGIDFLQDVAEIVYSHHERYDGSGYPRGLKGDEIPLGARIFGVVDAYDAMTSHRPYRKPTSHRLAVEEIVKHSGTQFDPEVIKPFLEAEGKGHIQEVSAYDEVDAFLASVVREESPGGATPAGTE